MQVPAEEVNNQGTMMNRQAPVTGDTKWRELLDERLALFTNRRYNVCQAFTWGSCLPNLADILGERFGRVFTRKLLDAGYQCCQEMLAEYDEPGALKRIFPESAEPGFQPSVEEFDPQKDRLGLVSKFWGSDFFTRHGGRSRPRHEIDFLISLAALGYEKESTMAQAVELLSHRKRVPQDFTYLISEDYDGLPETAHVEARGVGTIMVEWWRNYWFLQWIASREKD